MNETENITFSLKELLVGLKPVLVTTPPFPATYHQTFYSTDSILSFFFFYHHHKLQYIYIKPVLYMNDTLNILIHLYFYTPASLDCVFHKLYRIIHFSKFVKMIFLIQPV